MSRCSRVVRSAMWLRFSTSIVKLMVSCCDFMYIIKLLTVDLAVKMNVSSTYLSKMQGRILEEKI